MLYNDRDLRLRIGKQAHELIKTNYSVDVVGAKMLKVYEEVIEKF